MSNNCLFPEKVFISVTDAANVGFFSSLNANDAVKLITFDVRFSLDDPLNYGRTEYTAAHLPNAYFIDLDTELSLVGDELAKTAARHPLPSPSSFIATMIKAGVGVSQQQSKDGALVGFGSVRSVCLCYDDQCGGLAASRLWWMLYNLGVEAYVLDGGIQTYVAMASLDNATLPPLVVGGAVVPRQVGGLTGAMPQPSDAALRMWPYRTSWRHVVDGATISNYYFNNNNKNNNKPLYVDGRFATRFKSAERAYAGDKLPGHVPTSVNRPWNDNIGPSKINNNSKIVLKALRPVNELVAEFKALLPPHQQPLQKEKTFSDCIFSCASGVTACFNIAVATHIGLGTPMLYPGAWSECESLNKSFLINKAHKCSIGGTHRLSVIKRVPPTPSGKIVDGRRQLKVLEVRGGVGNYNNNSSGDVLLNLVAPLGQEAPQLFVGEVADVYVLDTATGEEVLAGRVEAVATPLSKL